MEHQMQNIPHALLDHVASILSLKNDAAMSRQLMLRPSAISKIRHRRTNVTAAILLTIHEETGIDLKQLRFLAGDFAEHTGAKAELLPEAKVRSYLEAKGIPSDIIQSVDWNPTWTLPRKWKRRAH
jgi:transcriptional regulator with XRE-family HTH domain